jgi:tetratricopeptide (TPR) repeat protein
LFLIFHVLKTRNRVLDWKNEFSLFTSALDVVPNNAKVYYNIGRISYDKKESETALKFYKKAIELYPNYESAHMNLGNLYRELQEYHKAKFHLLKATEIL